MEIPPGGKRLPVALLGATGSVGQRLVALLERHPWFELVALSASERSAGRTFAEAVRWRQRTPLPGAAAALRVLPPGAPVEAPLVFSALRAGVAGPEEERLARAGSVVVSNARDHRHDPGVPLVVPEVNAGHLELLGRPSAAGAIVTNPNCSTAGLVLALKPLADAFGLRAAHVVSLQALSGAGLSGPRAFDLVDNVLPFIAGEEEKIERETRRILGALGEDGVAPHGVVVSAQCNRVPVLDGHLLCVSVGLERKAGAAELREAWRAFRGPWPDGALPSAPARPVHVLEGDDVPQPRLHRDLEGGMSAAVGRVRPCPLLDHRFVTLSHNVVRGAAGGALLLAELLAWRGLVPRP